MLDTLSLTTRLKAAAAEAGFALSGVCPAVTPTGLAQLDEWLARGYAGQMSYIPARRPAYEHPRHVLDGVRSVLMLAMPYRTADPQPAGPGQGRIARYAWGAADYHDLMHDRLKQLIAVHRELNPAANVRGVVDTAPLLEREFAQLAGLGWIGKNTLLLSKHAGSYFFLAALLTDQELIYDQPHAADHCGTCRACLDACPTRAFPQPYVLDATRCISYLTIELRDSIPTELRSGMSDWLFGCDVCQEVCPWNRHAPLSQEADFQPRESANPLDLLPLFALDDDGFRRMFRRTPLWRSKRRGILRNAAIVLGNQKSTASIPALSAGLNDCEPLVRAAAAWALHQIGGAAAEQLLRCRAELETDPAVLSELAGATRPIRPDSLAR